MNISCIQNSLGECIFCKGHPQPVCPASFGFVASPIAAPPTHGPGTELKKLLARVGIVAADSCPCNARAAEMDRREQETPGWCEANLDTIVGWLREQAEARGLPFLDVAGRLLVRRAISNARKAAAGS